MELSKRDLYDRATILKIRCDHGMDHDKELAKIWEEIQPLDERLFLNLYQANLAIWNLEETIGKLALEVRAWNVKRNQIKNKISNKFGGFKERKTYANAHRSDNV